MAVPPGWIFRNAGGIGPQSDSHYMAFDPSGRLLVGNDGGIWRFDPTGETSWTNLNGNLDIDSPHPADARTVKWTGTDGYYSQINQTNPLICYRNRPIGSFGATTFFGVSTDLSNTLVNRIPTMTNGDLFSSCAPIFVDPSNRDRIFLGGDRLHESNTAGASWTTHAIPISSPINSIAVLPGGDTIYVSTGGTLSATSPQIWASTNDGSTWAQYNLPGGGAVQEIEIDPNDSTGDTAVAVINTFNDASGQVYRTTNGGASWTNISGNVPQLPAWSVKIGTDTSHTIYVSNDSGVYSSHSPYGAWSAVGTGLPHAQVVHLELNNSLGLLTAATHGRGAWSISPQVVTTPAISKAFIPITILSGRTSTVTLTLTNGNASALTGAAFSDTLVNMSAVGGAVGGTCGATTTLTGGQTALSFSGITIPAAGSCTVTFSVTSSTVGANPNTTSGVTTAQTPTAGSRQQHGLPDGYEPDDGHERDFDGGEWQL